MSNIARRTILSVVLPLALLTFHPPPLIAQTAAASADALTRSGIEAYNDGDYASALRLLRQAADKGDTYAQRIVAEMYMEGIGVQQDLAEARRRFRIAADKESGLSADARLALAAMYLEGAGGPRDAGAAVRLYRSAAADGNHDAQYNLGVLYLHGQGLSADTVQAFRWFEESANADAQYMEGLMRFMGWGVERDMGRGLFTMCHARGRNSDMAKADLNRILNVVPHTCSDIQRGYPPFATGQNDIASPEELRRHVTALLRMAGSGFAPVRGEQVFSRHGDVRSTYPIGSGNSFIREFERTGYIAHITRELVLQTVEFPSDLVQRHGYAGVTRAEHLIMMEQLERAVEPVIPSGWIKSRRVEGGGSLTEISWRECEGQRGRAVILRFHSIIRAPDDWSGGEPTLYVRGSQTTCAGSPNLP